MSRNSHELSTTRFALWALVIGLMTAFSGCGFLNPLPCDYDGDGICPPFDCDDNDGSVITDCEYTDSPGPTMTGDDDTTVGDDDTNPDPGDDDDTTPVQCSWYPDEDGDGFGAEGAEAVVGNCISEEHTGFSQLGTDCNDADDSINPEAEELCDDVDNDCDDSADEESDYYRDADGDGFGDPENTVKGCERPEGYVWNDDDCDDAHAEANPNGEEACNGLDDDCNGSIDDISGPLDSAVEDAHDSTGSARNSNAQGPTMTTDKSGSEEDTWVCVFVDFDGDKYGNPETGYSVKIDRLPPDAITNGDDCNDNDASVNPGAEEICNYVDENCNGEADDGLEIETYCQDKDGDGWGVDTNTTEECSQGKDWHPDDYSQACNDCDDEEGGEVTYPGSAEICDGKDNNCDDLIDEGIKTTFCQDKDGDGFGDPAETTLACQASDDYPSSCEVEDSVDCDDSVETGSSVYPGAGEQCNGLDDDCDGTTDENVMSSYYKDNDEDGYGNSNDSVQECEPPDDYVEEMGDCNDSDATIFPNAEELCDSKDNNCDGSTDENLATTTYYPDDDKDGFGDSSNYQDSCAPIEGWVTTGGDCDDECATCYPNVEEICDKKDNDCDGEVDEGVQKTYYLDSDGDVYGDPSEPMAACDPPPGYVDDSTDCDDGCPTCYPNAEETCDSADNDCDGDVDEEVQNTYYRDSDDDKYGDPSNPKAACDQPAGYVDDNTDCDDACDACNPNGEEICDEKDNDCDGEVDTGLTTTYYEDSDGDGWGNSAATSNACEKPEGYVEDNTDCDDGCPTCYPDATEVCDQQDNDCDGSIDEGVANSYYLDSDGDEHGDPAISKEACSTPAGYVENSDDCDDTWPYTYLGAAELCDEKDNDCDGSDDEGLDCPKCRVDAADPLAYSFIQDALDDVRNHFTFCESISVAPGTYLENIDFSGVDTVLVSDDGPETTILDGQSKGPVVSFADEDSNGTLSGFTLKGGVGQPGCQGTNKCGGGVYAAYGASPVLEDLVIVSNSATYGGGIYAYQCGSTRCSAPTIVNCRIGKGGASNSATIGGGLYVGGGATVSVSNSTISSNTATDNGGGVYIYDNASPIYFEDVTLSSNTSKSYSYETMYGGGLYMASSGNVDGSLNEGNPLVINGTFAATSNSGGGVYLANSTLQFGDQDVTLDFSNNTNGQGLYLSNAHVDGARMSSATLLVQGNTTDVHCQDIWGGGIFAAYSTIDEVSGSISITDNLLTDTYSSWCGDKEGAGMYLYYSTVDFSNATLTVDGNDADTTDKGYARGGGIRASYSTIILSSTLRSVISNNIATGYSGCGPSCAGGGMFLDNTSISLGYTSLENNSTNGLGGGIFLDNNPVSIDGVSVVGNTAGISGGAFYFKNSDVDIDGIVLEGSASTSGSGGAIYQEGGSLFIARSHFSAFSAGISGGAIQATGSLSIDQCFFGENSAPMGSAIDAAVATITSSIFANNTATTSGGTVRLTGTDASSVENCIFFGNVTSDAVDGIAGALWIQGGGSTKTIHHNTLTCTGLSNTWTGDLYIAGSAGSPTTVSLESNIFNGCDSTKGVGVSADENSSLEDDCNADTKSDNTVLGYRYAFGGSLSGRKGYTSDPQFVYASWEEDYCAQDLHLSAGSPYQDMGLCGEQDSDGSADQFGAYGGPGDPNSALASVPDGCGETLWNWDEGDSPKGGADFASKPGDPAALSKPLFAHK